MKTLFVSLLALVSLSAFAKEPTVGDFAIFNMSSNGFTGTYKIELTAFDATSNTFTQTYTTTVNGDESVDSEVVKAEDLNSTDTLEAMMEYCETPYLNGKLVTVDVPAGSISSCEVTGETGAITNMGVVPFGMIKVISSDANLELVSFGYGN